MYTHLNPLFLHLLVTEDEKSDSI